MERFDYDIGKYKEEIEMKLLIRSQDKTILTPINEPLIVFTRQIYGLEKQYKEYHIHYKNSNLGEYKSKERALEVLDEIQNILMPKCIINSKSMKLSKPYEENGMILMDCNADARLEQLSTYVYEMPKE